MTADRLIDEYSQLDDAEQKAFDERYRNLLKFRRGLSALTKAFIKDKKAEAAADKKKGGR